MHVGKSNTPCNELKVHGTMMQHVQLDTYLGDVIACDGSNHKNIEKRASRGNGLIADIMSILESVSLGKHYFKMAVLLRETLFLNSILTNTETWYGLTKTNIENLEMVDKILLRNILSTGRNTPIPMLYLELGCLRIQTIIKCRRLIFLHYLIISNKDKSLNKFFMAQWNYPIKDDWTHDVKKDLNDFNIQVDLNFIRNMTKQAFKKLVKVKARKYEINDLLKNDLSKMENLHFDKLELAKYLELQELTVTEAKAVFQFRSRMANFKNNYRGTNPVNICPLCMNHPDTQQSAFQCSVLRKNVVINGTYSNIIDGNISKELAITITNIMKFRETSQMEAQTCTGQSQFFVITQSVLVQQKY